MPASRDNTAGNAEHALPKIIGSDTEFGNVIIGANIASTDTGASAAQALLHEINGVSQRFSAGYFNPQDIGRKYLPQNGACCYIDLDHFEACTSETRCARKFTASWQGMLTITQEALAAANARLPDGCQVVATVNNSDGNGSSWGGHLSFLVHRNLFRQLCVAPERLPLNYLMSHQISSIVFSGAGKVGAENGKRPVPYQIAQRADFFTSLLGPQTTHDRPLVNTRDEPLCGPSRREQQDMSRLHVIFYDSNLAPVATYLKVGVMQIILSMLEANRANPLCLLADPLGALCAWSHDPDLDAKATLTLGQRVTAVEHQMMILEDAQAFVASGAADAYVPGAQTIVALWEDTLLRLQRRDWQGLVGRLDWVAKRSIIERAVQHNQIGWDSAEAKHLDLMFASLDPADGLHWMLARDGLIESVNSPQEIEFLIENPPPDTRAWTRAMLLRHAADYEIEHINWDRIRVRHADNYLFSPGSTLELSNPLCHTRDCAAGIFSTDRSLTEMIAALGSANLCTRH